MTTSVLQLLEEGIARKVIDAKPMAPMPVLVSYRDPDLEQHDRTGIVSFRGDLTCAETALKILAMARAAHVIGEGLHIAPVTERKQ